VAGAMIPPYVPPPELIGLQAAIAQLEGENAIMRDRVKRLRNALGEIAGMSGTPRMKLLALAAIHLDRRGRS